MNNKCGEACQVFSRVTGYYRPISNWNRGKQSEAADRVMFRVDGSMKDPHIFERPKTFGDK